VKRMLQTIIFKKAKVTLFNSLIQNKGEGKTKEYFTIPDLETKKDNEVTIEQTQNGLVFSCTCLHKTFHIDKPVLCSHIVTVILFKCSKINIRQKGE
jgi:hypothetical protein